MSKASTNNGAAAIDITDGSRVSASTAKATLGKLVNYIATNALADVRPGENAADVAIRWHQELKALRDMRAQRATTESRRRAEDQPAWRQRLDQCEAILNRLDDMPTRATEFAESVRETVTDMRAWIEEHRDVTGPQCTALNNTEAAVEKWIR